MIFLNKKLVAFIVAGSTLLAISCQDEGPVKEPDTESPVVKLGFSENQEELFGEITLKATVEDNQGIETISFYLDDEFIGEATEEPFEINWDSGEVEDGPYILKVIATDKSGNKAEDSREINVRNTLMSIHLEEGYRSNILEYDFSEEWFFISNKEGGIIGEPQKLNPGETIRWKRPADFTDEKIVINRFAYVNRESTRFNPKVLYILDSYADLPATNMVLSGTSPANDLGSAEIIIENSLPQGEKLLFSARTGFSSITFPEKMHRGERVTLTPTIFENEQQECLLTYTTNYGAEGEERIPHFYWMDIKLHEQYQISADLFEPMMAKEVSFPDEKGSGQTGYTSLYGRLKDQNNEKNGFHLSRIDFDVKIFSGNFYIPEDIFSEYFVEGQYGKFSEYYYKFRLNSIPDVIAKPDFTASVINSDLKSVELTTNKKHDGLFLAWSYGETIDGIWEYIDRRLYLGKETDGQYVLPDVPEILIEEYPILKNPVRYIATQLFDYKDISSYQEYFNGIYGSNSDNIDLYYFESLVLYGNEKDNSGARINTFDNQYSEELMQEHVGGQVILR